MELIVRCFSNGLADGVAAELTGVVTWWFGWNWWMT